MQESHISDAVAMLGHIASQYPADGSEAGALRLAAFALLYVENENLVAKLSQFIAEQNAPLSDEQRAILKRMGIEP